MKCISLFSLFESIQREGRQENRINGGNEKKTRETNLAKIQREKTNRDSKKRKAPSHKGLHVQIAVACVTASETKWKPWNRLIPRTSKILPSSWFGRVLAYSIQFQCEALSILCKEQIVIFHLKYTRWTDLMSSVKLRHYHQLLVSFLMYGLVIILLFLRCVFVHNVSLYWTTDRQGPCHHW